MTPLLPPRHQELHSAQPFLRLFPAPSEVFAADLPRHCLHFAPLASVDLAAVTDDLSGWLHFVTPFEPHDSLVGNGTEDTHSHYVRANWVGFRVVDGRYEFLGDWRYFWRERTEADVHAEVVEHCVVAQQAFQDNRALFERCGVLPYGNVGPDADGVYPREGCQTLVDELGGDALYGNWAGLETFPTETSDVVDADGETWTRALPLTADGRPFRYIGCVPGYAYFSRPGDLCAAGADGVLLFYDPVESIALLTFDWS